MLNSVATEEKLSDQREAQLIAEFLNCRENCGWAQRAFVLAFYFLQKWQALPSETFYQDAIKLTIQQGGDTDTNACIVGGLVGALAGVKDLPEDMLNPVLSFDSTTDGVKRPEFLSVKR